MYDVFISYSREDREHARRLANAFEAARGWSVWWDEELRTGEQFPRRIQEALEQVRCVVVVWSCSSVDSRWVASEANEGWERGVLVPVRIEECEPPMPFRQTETADLTGWNGSRRSGEFLAVVEDVQRVLSRGDAPRREELEQRESRRRRHRRRILKRRLGIGIAAFAVVVVAWLTIRSVLVTRERERHANRIAEHAVTVRERVLALTDEEENKIWGFVLFEGDPGRLDRMDLCALLGVEAVRAASTDRAVSSLRDCLALLPWSDVYLDIDDDDLVSALEFSADASLLAAGGGAGGTSIWNLESNSVVARIPHGGTAGENRWSDLRGRFSGLRGSYVLDMSPVADVVATAGPDDTVRLWEAGTGRELHRLDHAGTATAVRFSGTGELVTTSSEGGDIHVWDARSGTERWRFDGKAAAYQVGFSPSGKYVQCTTIDGVARVFEASSGDEIVRVDLEGIEAARFDPDERTLVTFGRRVETIAWDVELGERLWAIPASSAAGAGVVFSADGRTVVLGDVEGQLGWWRVGESGPFRTAAVNGFVRGMAASLDRRYVATIGGFEVAHVFELGTGRELKRMPYGRGLMGVAVSPDGRYLATAGGDLRFDRAIEVTRILPDDPVEVACAQVHRNLTREEWHRYIGSTPYRPTCPGIEERARE